MAKAKGKAEKPIELKKNFWADDRKAGYLLAAFAFLLYAQTIGFGYTLDDVAVLSANTYVHKGFKGFGDILSTYYWHGNASFSESNSGLFRPVSLLMFATEWQIFGDKPQAFHFVHVLLYALTSFQLYRWLTEMIGRQGGRIALFATLIWIVLPIHTEVVANLKSADEVLSLLFSILGLRFLLKWSSNNSILTIVIAGLFFFLAFLSKEAAILILPMGLLMLMMFREKKVKQLIVPGAILMGFALLWLTWHQSVIANASSERFDYDYRHNALLSNSSAVDQLGTAIGLQARYWVKMLIGYPLSYNYSFNEIPVNGFADFWPWLSLAGIGVGGFFAFRHFRTMPVLSFAIIFYFVTMLLTSNVFYKIGDIFAERFTFIPSIGFCILIAMLILRGSKTQYVATSSAIGIIVVLCVIYSVRTYARSSDWKDDNTLFLADVEHSTNSGRVHGNVGAIYLNSALADSNAVSKRQSFEMAFNAYSRAFEIDNRDYGAASALGQVMYHKGDYNASVMWSERSIAVRRELLKQEGLPLVDDWNTLQNTGDAFVRLEKFDSARYYYTASSKVFPRAEIYEKIGDAYLRARDTTAAIASYGDAVKIDSSYIQCWDKIANLNGMRGDFPASNAAFLKIAALRPADLNPWKMLYTNYQAMGDTIGATNAAKEYYKRGGK